MSKTLIRLTPHALLFALTLVVFTGFRGGTVADRAAKIHAEALLIDGHNDLAWRLREFGDMELKKFDIAKVQTKLHTDIPRLRQGGMGAQFWSAYVPSDLMETGTAVKVTREQVDLIHRIVAKYADTFAMAGTASDIERIRAEGKIASLIGLEGGHSIDNSLAILNEFYDKGARYMTLAHWKNLDWVESATDVQMKDPLTPFGEKVIAEMNRLGMFADISHISARAMREVLAVTKAPVIASHSSAYAIKNHVRNVPDDVLKLVAGNGGVVMVNFYPAFISNEETDAAGAGLDLSLPVHDCEKHDVAMWARTGSYPRANVGTLVDHIDHIVKVAGIDHVGLGSDFDGVPLLPEGLEDVSKYPAITEEMLRRGYTEVDIRKVLGGNLMRALHRIEEVSGTLRERNAKARSNS